MVSGIASRLQSPARLSNSNEVHTKFPCQSVCPPARNNFNNWPYLVRTSLSNSLTLFRRLRGILRWFIFYTNHASISLNFHSIFFITFIRLFNLGFSSGWQSDKFFNQLPKWQTTCIVHRDCEFIPYLRFYSLQSSNVRVL